MSKQLKAKSNLEKLIESGIPCYYARFHQPVPAALNKEPVSEFKLGVDVNSKYLVDAMWITQFGLVYEAYGEIDIVNGANIIYVRTASI